MPSFRLTVAYDGTGLVGWQRQANGLSVQGLLESAATALDGRAVAVAGAGRTDAGVHALGQVASLSLVREMAAPALVRALNAHLPPAVRVIDAEAVAASFHARFDATSKTYRYHLWTGVVLPPLLRHVAWHVPAPDLRIADMDGAARLLEGRHDFAAFQSTGSEVTSTTRTLYSSRVHPVAIREADGLMAGLCAGALIAYEVCGDGFLRHMVRSVVGTLVDVGRGREEPAWVLRLLAACNRSQAGPAAPAGGLCLVRVSYEANDRGTNG